MNIKLIISSFLIILAFFGCKENYISSIPEYPVSLQLNLTASYPTFKNSINQYITIDKPIYSTDRIGYGGVLICSGQPDSYGNARYYAYDLACPVEVKRDVKVVPLPDALFTVKCESCGSEFFVGDGFGMPSKGEAKESLKKYKTSLSSGDMLYVFR